MYQLITLLVLATSIFAQDIHQNISRSAAAFEGIKPKEFAAWNTLPYWSIPGEKQTILGGNSLNVENIPKTKRKLFTSILCINKKHGTWSEMKNGARLVWKPTQKFSLGAQVISGKLGTEFWTFVRFDQHP